MTETEIVVHGRHVDISTRFREFATGKLVRVERFGVPIDLIDVELSEEKNPRQSDNAFKVELTCRGSGPVIRAEAHSADKYSALDIAAAKLEEQVRRAHDRASRRHRNPRNNTAPPAGPPNGAESADRQEAPVTEVDPALLPPDDEVFAVGPVIVREKAHAVEAMSVEEAVTAMELVGHDFYLFTEVETGTPAVVYRRHAFDYGLIRIATNGSGG